MRHAKMLDGNVAAAVYCAGQLPPLLLTGTPVAVRTVDADQKCKQPWAATALAYQHTYCVKQKLRSSIGFQSSRWLQFRHFLATVILFLF